MKISLIEESDNSIKYFTDFLYHLRFMKSLYNDISEYFSSEEEIQNLSDFYKLNDISSLITICHLDLITNSKNLYLVKSDWEKIFFIKNTYLVIYETINSYHKHGKFLYLKSQKNKELSEEYLRTNDYLKQFKNKYKYSTHINKIRNSISGHIGENFEEYYDEIMNFDAEKTSLMTIDFFIIIEKTHNLLTEMMKNVKLDITKIPEEKLQEIQKKLKQI